jgi:hypothetical protein
MLNTALFDILKKFTKDETKEFDLLINSPYFNRKSAVIKFWEVIKRYAPYYASPELEREKIYSKIFPGKAFNYGTMKNLVYDLTKLAEKLIELKTYERDHIRRSLNMLEGYLERGLNSNFEKNIDQAEKNLEQKKGEMSYYSNKHLLGVLRQNYLIQQDKHYMTRDLIHSANENLTLGYFIDIIDNNYNSLFMQGELSGISNNDFIEKVLAFYDSNPVEMDFKVKIYYYAFMLVWNGSTGYFDELKNQLEGNLDKLSNEHKYNFFVALANFCLKKYNEGQDEFVRKEHDIYRFMIENGIFSIDKIKNMDGTFYKNVAVTAIKSGECEWAVNFIEKYKDMVEEDVRENYYFHALIEYHIKLKNFQEARSYLARIKHTNYVDKLNIKQWEIITSYELKLFEELRYIIDAARHFLQSDKKISEPRKKRLSNFVQVVNRLVLLSEKNIKNGEGADEIRTVLNGMDTPNKSWIIEKLNELNPVSDQ